MNRDTRYLKRERWDDGDGFDLSLRQCARLWAAAPSGSKRQRAARSQESDESLARKAAAT